MYRQQMQAKPLYTMCVLMQKNKIIQGIFQVLTVKAITTQLAGKGLFYRYGHFPHWLFLSIHKV